MTAFAIDPELRIGRLLEVSGSSLRIELDGAISELMRTHHGRVYAIGQFGSIIKIHFGRTILFAYVRLLRMRSELAMELGDPVPKPSEDSRIIEADLFAEGSNRSAANAFDLVRGVRCYPLPGQSAYLATDEELRLLFRSVEAKKTDDGTALIPLGTYVASDGTQCLADMNKLFGLHCAVLGSTGSGKSATVAAILHSVVKHKPKGSDDAPLRPRVILIDPHGEYLKAFGKHAAVFQAYFASASDATRVLRLPYWTLSAAEWRELVVGKSDHEATSENNIVFKAMLHARLVERGWIEESKDWVGKSVDSGFEPSEPRLLSESHRDSVASYDADTPDPFSLDEFERHIRWEQTVRAKGANPKWEQLSPTDFKPYASVLDKLRVLRTDRRLKFLMEEYKGDQTSLSVVLSQFVGCIESIPDAAIRIIDISGLPNEVAGPLTAAIARLLFQFKIWETQQERERDPILFVCEEAHRYVPDAGLAEYQSAQDAIRRIAKEGRKYGLGLMLVSQRPSDVERTVLSQCNSWIIMRLTNTTDQEYVARFLPDSLSGLSKLLPSLARQQAIFVGEAAVIPARISVTTLTKEQRPASADVSFIKGWSRPPLSSVEIDTVVRRWRRDESDAAAPDRPVSTVAETEKKRPRQLKKNAGSQD